MSVFSLAVSQRFVQQTSHTIGQLQADVEDLKHRLDEDPRCHGSVDRERLDLQATADAQSRLNESSKS